MGNLLGSELGPGSYALIAMIFCFTAATVLFTEKPESATPPPPFGLPRLDTGTEPPIMPEPVEVEEPPPPDPAIYSPTGYRYGDPDPCASYIKAKPNFSSDEWLLWCEEHHMRPSDDINSECQNSLYLAWAYGDTDKHPSFKKPDGCHD